MKLSSQRWTQIFLLILTIRIKKNQLHFTSEDLNLKGFNHSKNTGEKRKFKFPGDQQTHDEESYDPQC